MHFSGLALTLLPVLAAAAPANIPRQTYGEDPYTIMALRSASPVHFLPMNAAGRAFWLGGETASYCPELDIEGFECPPGNQTVLVAPGNDLSTEVPGGQEIYVEPSGALGFTQAHSGQYPTGSVLNPLTYEPIEGAAFDGYVSTKAFNATGLMACPTSTGAYQVFAAIKNATVPTGNVADCLGFSAAAITYSGPTPAAWQYT